MRRAFTVLQRLAVAAALCGVVITPQGRAEERAFDHYERIRSALAQDTTKGISVESKALAPLAREIAGEAAGQAAASLAQASDIEKARDRYGVLSEALVPKFLEAGLPGVQGFVCSMKQKRWVQRGSTVANPYYGKAMATCGTPIEPRRSGDPPGLPDQKPSRTPPLMVRPSSGAHASTVQRPSSARRGRSSRSHRL